MKVVKFGGTSVGSAEALKNVKSIVENCSQPVIVVVSALGGFTNQLLEMTRLASSGDVGYEMLLAQARQRHIDVADAVVPQERLAECKAVIGQFFDQSLPQFFAMLMLNPDIDAFSRSTIEDAIVCHGEILSSAIVTAMIDGAVPHFSPGFIKTVDRDGTRSLDAETTERLIRQEWSDAEPLTHVVQGFIASDVENANIKTTLGRGGSDFTAALIAAALDAECLEIWTDVDGFMTADPRTHPDATVIPQMTYDEAQAMCDAGAKVIYPPTIAPVAMKHIPVWVKNTFNPTTPGTVIQ